MSRIGILPISIPEQVTITQSDMHVLVKGPKGQLSVNIPKEITTKQENGQIMLTRKGDSINEKALHGLSRSLVANAVYGVTEGFTKTLEIKGVGYRAKVDKDKLVLTVGFSHPVEITQPEGITFQVKGAKIMVSGIDRQYVGEIAAQIRRVRPPDAYKGKGIRYEGEFVRLKPGKAAKAAGAA
ncbi:50S ribosomal protein L6 [Candidatus Roizmanbacteria bacterium]|nr:50S ribosomal protein L6 [Candidatus Roizmanbacteria bacterium]